jgi:hypothetical protein
MDQSRQLDHNGLRISLTQRSLRLLTLSLLGSILIGCTYLHYPDRQAAAEKLQQQLKTYSENSPEAYRTMRPNLSKFEINEDAALAALGQNAVEAAINKYPSMSDESLTADLRNTKTDVDVLKDKIRVRDFQLSDQN